LNFTRIVAVFPLGLGAADALGEELWLAGGDGLDEGSPLGDGPAEKDGLGDAAALADADGLGDTAALADGDGSATGESGWCPATTGLLEKVMSAMRIATARRFRGRVESIVAPRTASQRRHRGRTGPLNVREQSHYNAANRRTFALQREGRSEPLIQLGL